MISVFNEKELLHLLEDFYRITRIRITVFDERFQEIISFPDGRPEFCQIIRACEEGYIACTKCDEEACAYASKERKTHIYRCHAGLTEAITPLYVGKVLVGYLLFGHVFAYDSFESGYAAIAECCRKYPVDMDALRNTLYGMPQISHAYIQSAAQILRMTASFLALERMATLQEDTLAAKLDKYLSDHYTEPITAERLCDALGLGRSKLFKLSQEVYGCGIQQQVRKLRMEKARDLLVDRLDLSIMDVATACGYDDYNYFIAVFSKFHGKSPKQFRQENHERRLQTEEL